MGTGKGKKQETNLQNQAQAQMNAWQPTTFESEEEKRINQFRKDWDSGKDISEMAYVKPYFNLYNSSVNRNVDEQGVGALGFNQLSGASGNMAGLIGEQLKSRRQQDASGQLYNAANQAYTGATDEGNFLAQMAEGRMGGKANLANQRYTAYLHRPKKPSIWEQLLGGAMQAGAAYAGAA